MGHRRLWSALSFGVALAGIVLYLLANHDELAVVSTVSGSQLVALMALRCVFLTANGLSLRECAAKFGVRLASVEWFGLSVVTAMGNYLTPLSGGLVARAVYLRRRHSLPYSAFAALLASNYLVAFGIVGTAGAACTSMMSGPLSLRGPVAAVFAAVAVAVFIVVALPVLKVPGQGRMSRALNAALQGWLILKTDRPLLLKLVGLTALNITVGALSFQIAYQALGLSVSFADALLVSLLTVLTLLVSITPGNLGVQEAMVGLTSGLLHGEAGQGVLASLLIRAATLLPVFGLGPVFSTLLARRSAEAVESSPAPPKEGADQVG